MTRPRRVQIGLTILVVAFYLAVLYRNLNESERRSLLLSETPIAGDYMSISIRVADVNLGTSELTARISFRLEGSLARDPVTPSVDLKLMRAVNSEVRSEEHTSELQSRQYLVCRLLLEKKKKKK